MNDDFTIFILVFMGEKKQKMLQKQRTLLEKFLKKILWNFVFMGQEFFWFWLRMMLGFSFGFIFYFRYLLCILLVCLDYVIDNKFFLLSINKRKRRMYFKSFACFLTYETLLFDLAISIELYSVGGPIDGEKFLSNLFSCIIAMWL